MSRRTLFLILVGFLYTACTSSSLFQPIGTRLGNPLMLAVNATTSRLYVVNSNNKDLYSNGSVQVYNITSPTAPTLVGTAATDSFSSQIYLDTVNQFLYTPNRINETINSTSGQVLQVNINEASASFMGVTSSTAGGSPFGIACCDPAGQALVASLAGVLNAYTLGAGAPTMTSTNLSTTASDGTVYTNPAVNQLAIIGAQAFVTIPAGNILVVNLSKLGGSANPVDYVITGVISPRGIATDGTLLYVADVETINGVTTPVLNILNPALNSGGMPALSGNTTATNVAMSTILAKQLTMGNGTVNTDPEQVVVGTTYVFVSCMGDDLVTVVNKTAQTVNSNITVGDQPFGMATLTPAGADTFLYVANVQDNTLSIIDLATLAVAATYAGP
jgi:YVTN family beta-propeller protein